MPWLHLYTFCQLFPFHPLANIQFHLVQLPNLYVKQTKISFSSVMFVKFCECANVLFFILHVKRVLSPPHLPPSFPAEMKYFKIVSKLFLSLLKFAMTFCLWVGADSTRRSGCFCHCTVTADLTTFATVL